VTVNRRLLLYFTGNALLRRYRVPHLPLQLLSGRPRPLRRGHGRAAAALSFGGLLALLPAGWGVDRWGARSITLVSALGAALGLCWGAVTRTPGLIYCASAVVGVAGTSWRVAQAPILMELSSVQNRSRLFAWDVALLLAGGGRCDGHGGPVCAMAGARRRSVARRGAQRRDAHGAAVTAASIVLYATIGLAARESSARHGRWPPFRRRSWRWWARAASGWPRSCSARRFQHLLHAHVCAGPAQRERDLQRCDYRHGGPRSRRRRGRDTVGCQARVRWLAAALRSGHVGLALAPTPAVRRCASCCRTWCRPRPTRCWISCCWKAYQPASWDGLELAQRWRTRVRRRRSTRAGHCSQRPRSHIVRSGRRAGLISGVGGIASVARGRTTETVAASRFRSGGSAVSPHAVAAPLDAAVSACRSVRRESPGAAHAGGGAFGHWRGLDPRAVSADANVDVHLPAERSGRCAARGDVPGGGPLRWMFHTRGSTGLWSWIVPPHRVDLARSAGAGLGLPPRDRGVH